MSAKQKYQEQYAQESPNPLRDLFSMEQVYIGIKDTYLDIEPALARVQAAMWFVLFLGAGWAWMVGDILETYNYISPIKEFFVARQSSHAEMHTFFAGAFVVFATASGSIFAWLGPRFDENGVGILRIAFWVGNALDIPTNLGIVNDALTWMGIEGLIYRTLLGVGLYALFSIVFETIFMVSTWGLLYSIKASFKGFKISIRSGKDEIPQRNHIGIPQRV